MSPLLTVGGARTIGRAQPGAASGGGGGLTGTWDNTEDWSSVTTIAGALARPNVISTDYTYTDESEVDGLSLNTTVGDPWSESGKCIQSNIPIGAQGFASGGGLGYEFATGAATAEEMWGRVALYAPPGYDPTGTGGGNPDHKILFNADGASYNGSGQLISTGRMTIGKFGNNGTSFLDRVYSYPNTSFDTNYLAMADDIGNLGWVLFEFHSRAGVGATNGIHIVRATPWGGSPVTLTIEDFNPSARYLGYLSIFMNLNQFISTATLLRLGVIQTALSDPGIGI